MSVYFIIFQVDTTYIYVKFVQTPKAVGMVKIRISFIRNKKWSLPGFLHQQHPSFKTTHRSLLPFPPQKNLPNHQSLSGSRYVQTKGLHPVLFSDGSMELPRSSGPVLGFSTESSFQLGRRAAGGCAAVVGSRGSRSTKRIEELL